MDQGAFNAGKAAYMKGDYATAQAMLNAACEPGEVNGALNHMRGNALMKMGMYKEAAFAYQEILKDATYGKRGAIYTNLGRALSAAGQDEEAIAALSEALKDSSYQSPYKAQIALGKLLERRGDARAAGAAFRAAAIDERNPDPSVALASLGACFMSLGRPLDAVEAYRTALDFSSPRTSQASIYAHMGEAFVAANRMPQALDAFNHVEEDPTFSISPSQQAAYMAARNAMGALVAQNGTDGSTDAFLHAAGYGGTGAYDPLDPLGKSGEFIPSPEDTGFFSISEQDLVAEEKRRNHKEKVSKAKNKRTSSQKKKHTGVKVVIVLIIVLLIAALGVGCWGYFNGYGIPDAPDVTQDLFYAKTDGTDLDRYIAPSVDDATKAAIKAILPAAKQVDITSTTRSKDECVCNVTATISQGVQQSYVVNLVRDGLGWRVNNISLSFSENSTANQSQSDSNTTTSGTKTETGTVSSES